MTPWPPFFEVGWPPVHRKAKVQGMDVQAVQRELQSELTTAIQNQRAELQGAIEKVEDQQSELVAALTRIEMQLANIAYI